MGDAKKPGPCVKKASDKQYTSANARLFSGYFSSFTRDSVAVRSMVHKPSDRSELLWVSDWETAVTGIKLKRVYTEQRAWRSSHTDSLKKYIAGYDGNKLQAILSLKRLLLSTSQSVRPIFDSTA